MGKKVLDVKNLTIQYRTDLETVHAVNGISFSLEKGETLGLVGETGAGKTTTALGIMGLLPERTAVIPEGSIEFEGTDLLKLSEQEMQKVRGSQISMIFQDPMTALNPVLPVGKQIGEALFLHNEENLSKDEIEKKVEETLELVGIPKARKVEYPYQFSGGMRQRVVIAIALVCNPAASDRRRAHDGSGCDDSGTDPHDDLQPSKKIWNLRYYDHPRPGRCGGDLR